MPPPPPVEVMLVMPAPLVRATPLRTRPDPEPVMVLPVPPRVLPVSVTSPAALLVIATLFRFKVPVKDVVVPSMAMPEPVLWLIVGLAAPAPTLTVPPPDNAMPILLPAFDAVARPLRLIVLPVLPLSVSG